VYIDNVYIDNLGPVDDRYMINGGFDNDLFFYFLLRSFVSADLLVQGRQRRTYPKRRQHIGTLTFIR
jgi:hypothetical protein